MRENGDIKMALARPPMMIENETALHNGALLSGGTRAALVQPVAYRHLPARRYTFADAHPSAMARESNLGVSSHMQKLSYAGHLPPTMTTPRAPAHHRPPPRQGVGGVVEDASQDGAIDCIVYNPTDSISGSPVSYDGLQVVVSIEFADSIGVFYLRRALHSMRQHLRVDAFDRLCVSTRRPHYPQAS